MISKTEEQQIKWTLIRMIKMDLQECKKIRLYSNMHFYLSEITINLSILNRLTGEQYFERMYKDELNQLSEIVGGFR